VPDDPDAAIPFRAEGEQGAFDRSTHREVLVVLRPLLDQLVPILLEHDEVADVVEQPLLREEPLDQGLH